jgi:hypothetical protein
MAAQAEYPVYVAREAAEIEVEPGQHLIPAAAPAGSPAIFFDNDMAKINDVRGMCNNIELVKVPETETAILYADPTARVITYPALWTGYDLTANSYYKFLNVHGHSKFDIRSGMQIPEFTIINDWVQRTQMLGPARKAIFDWDRTLTMIEGATFPPVPPGPPITLRQAVGQYAPYSVAAGGPGIAPANYVEDMLIYSCGGLYRLQSLRNMFAYLRENGVDIVILTNSGACLPDRAPYFQEVINALVGVPGYVPQVVCGPLFGGHKGLAMRTIVPGLCLGPMAGGRRAKRLSRRVLRRGRKTRRRR